MTIYDPDDIPHRTGPSKRQMEEDLRRAVLNTGGTLVKPIKEPAAAVHARQMGRIIAQPVMPPVPVPQPVRQRKHEDLKSEGLRRIDASNLTPVKAETEIGARPRLLWLPLTRLYVDDRYQRNVLEKGLTNVYRIAREFDWRKFSPVIAAEVEDRFAIVDGQHRCYAAALRDIDEVPCFVIKATVAEQAAAFAAINGRVTRISELHVHAAAVTAGDADAVALHDVCSGASVTICRYPVPESAMKPGQTLAIGTLRQCLNMHGGDVLRLALRCIMAAHGKTPGALRAPIIRALCDVIAGLNGKRRDGAEAVAARLDLISMIPAAKIDAAGTHRSVHAVLADKLCALLDPVDSKR